MSDIYMIRHGQASFGGDTYDRLSPLGHRQAQIVAADMLSKKYRFDAVYHGTLDRQRNTAEALFLLCGQLGIDVPEPSVSEAFNEYDSESVVKCQVPLMLQEEPGLSQKVDRIYTDRKAFQYIFEKAMRRWTSGRHDPPGEPTWTGFKSDVRQGIQALMQRHGAKKRIAVFTSGGPISVAIQAALSLSDETTMEISWQLMNASVTRFKYNSQGMALAGFNDIGHLERENDPALLTYR